MAEATTNSERYLAFLRGSKDPFDLGAAVKDDCELFTRALAYVIDQKSFYRGNVLKALVTLINGPNAAYRNIAWALIQSKNLPLSFMLDLPDVVDKKTNTRRLRYALVNKIAHSYKKDIVRAYFFGPEAFRSWWKKLYLPRDKCDDRNITRETYVMAYKLSQSSIPEAMKELKVTPTKLVKDFGIPLDKVMGLTSDPEEYKKLFETANSDDFLNHARNFKNVMGDAEYAKLANEKIKSVKDPHAFLGIKKHLEETGAVTEEMTSQLSKRAEEIFEKRLKEAKVENLALLVDVSGSMEQAVMVSKQLYEAFSAGKAIKSIIAFNTTAFEVSAERLPSLQCKGGTSIGCAIVHLFQKKKANYDAILIVTDKRENQLPYLASTYELLEQMGKPPIIFLQVQGSDNGSVVNVGNAYANATIEVGDFHKSLLSDIIGQVVRLTSKVAVQEKVITEAVKERKIMGEELGNVELPIRPPETLVSKYLPNLLCS